MLAMQKKFKKKRFKKPRKGIRKKLPWNHYQRNIFTDIQEGEGHTIVVAAPGSGKTETGVEGLYYTPEPLRKDNRVMYTAFSRAIANTLKARVPEGVMAKTTHQIGFHTTLRQMGHVYDLRSFGSVDTRNESLFQLANEQVGDSEELEKLRQALVYAIDLCKTTLADSIEDIEAVTLGYGVDYRQMTSREFAHHIYEMMEKCETPQIFNGKSVITYGDMIWLPHRHGWLPDQHDRVFIDEGQDLSAARRELVLNACAYGGRIYTLADPMQAIFNFAGADERAVQYLQENLGAKTLPLSVTYRCPTSIVELAKRINPQIEAAPNAIEGTIDNFEAFDIYDKAELGSVILSRTNFPLVRLCFGFLARNVKANIRGRDIGKRLLWRIDCWAPETVDELKKSILNWKSDIVQILLDKRRPYTHIEDEAATLMEFANQSLSVEQARKYIKEFFTDDIEDNQIELSTAHKYKGLEKSKVYLLGKTFHPERGGEEERIYYVAITRTKNYLGFAEGPLP